MMAVRLILALFVLSCLLVPAGISQAEEQQPQGESTKAEPQKQDQGQDKEEVAEPAGGNVAEAQGPGGESTESTKPEEAGEAEAESVTPPDEGPAAPAEGAADTGRDDEGTSAGGADKAVAIPPQLVAPPNSVDAAGPDGGADSDANPVFTPTEPQGQAGNVADAGGAGASEAADNVADVERAPAGEPREDGNRPPGMPDDSDLFGGKDRGDVPEFARDHPDFIPDTRPEDLFESTRSDQSLSFFSLLGRSKLPPGEVQTYLQRYRDNPDLNLPEGFARVVVPSGSITGSTESKQFHIENGVIIYYSEIILSADMADIDEKNEMAVLYGNVQIVDPKYTLKTDELRVFFNDKRFQAVGFVQFIKQREGSKARPRMELEKKDRLREYFAGQQFELYCNELYYNWDSKEMAALDGVRLVHPVFNGTMDRIDYNDETKEYEISGKVSLDVLGYDWIFENQLVDPEDEEQVRAITDADTKITCDRLVYAEDDGIARFYAQSGQRVAFDQGVRVVRAGYMEVNDQTKDFYAEGVSAPVEYRQTSGEWLYAGGIIDEAGTSEDLKETLTEALTTSSDTLVYNFDRKYLALRGLVQMTAGKPGSQKSINADEMVQDETAKYFLLRGNVKIQPDNNSEIYAAQVYLDTENDVFTFVGLVQGKLESDDLPSSERDQAGGGEYEIAEGLFNQSDIPGVTGGTSASGRRQDGSNVAEGE